jgi:hypothetical protein
MIRFFNIIILWSIFSCKIDKNPPPPPPFPEHPKLDCPTIKTYCEPDDSADYQHVIGSFYRKKDGVLYERKTIMDYDVMGWGCCKYGVQYVNGMGHLGQDGLLDSFIDVHTYVDMPVGICYSKDKNHVYYFVDNIDGGFRYVVREADAKTFVGLSDYRWGMDKNTVFFKGSPLEGIRVKEAQLLRFDSTDIKPNYIKDSKSVFYQSEKIEKADTKTFKVVERGIYDYDAFDKNHKYSSGEVVKY